MNARRWRWWLGSVPLIAVLALALRGRPVSPLPVYGEVPPFEFTAHTGKTLSRDDLRGHVWVADFIFTRCAGQCPIMTGQMHRLQEALRDHPEVKLVSFTVDPQTDTPSLLARYAKRWQARAGQWYFLTGEKKAIYALARQGFKVAATQGDGGPLDFIHSDRFILVDAQGRIRGYYHGTDAAEVDRLLRDLRRLLRE